MHNEGPRQHTSAFDSRALLAERANLDTSSDGSGALTTVIALLLPTPSSTVTLDTTLLRTKFVTITQNPVPTTAMSCLESETSQCNPHQSHSQSQLGSRDSNDTPRQTRPHSTTLHHFSTPTLSPRTTKAATTAVSSVIGKHSDLSATQRRAIIGGLAGTLAGLVLIGFLLALFLRRRRAPDVESTTRAEKGMTRSVSRTWSQFITPRTVIAVPHRPASRQSSFAEFNGSLIRVNESAWARPFAHHQSFRESMGLGKLQITNPDVPSGTATPVPRGSLESSNTYFKRQRTAIAAALLGGTTRSRANSSTPSGGRRSMHLPTISIDGDRTRSFRSYRSIKSARTIQQQRVEDPFLTPPMERSETNQHSPGGKAQTPNRAFLHSAAGSASKSLAHLGQALNPFRPRTAISTAEHDDDGRASRNSTMTFSSNGDPFKLDRRSPGPDSSVTPRRA